MDKFKFKIKRAKKSSKETVQKANQANAVIICANETRRYEIMHTAKVNGYQIQKPLTVDEVISGKFQKGNYIIDHIDDITQMLIYRYLLKALWQKGKIEIATVETIYLPDILEAEYDI